MGDVAMGLRDRIGSKDFFGWWGRFSLVIKDSKIIGIFLLSGEFWPIFLALCSILVR